MANEATKRRHAKQRARLKAHFEKKRNATANSKERASVKKHFEDKAIGSTAVSKDGKYSTTSKNGWSITTGVQKKTLPGKVSIPKPKKTTHGVGKAGTSTVVDAGRNPSKDTLKLATQMARGRKQKKAPNHTQKDIAHTKNVAKVTAPKPTEQSAAKAPVVSVPKADASNKTDGGGIGGKILTALGVAAGAGAALLGMSKAGSKTKPPTLGLPKPNKGLPKPQLGLPGPGSDKAAEVRDTNRKRNVLSDLQKKAAPGAQREAERVARAATQRHAAVGDLKATSDARRAKQGAELKNAFGAAERADARAAAKKVATPRPGARAQASPDLKATSDARRAKQGETLRNAFRAADRADARKSAGETVKVGTTKINAQDLVDQKPKQIIQSRLNNQGEFETKVVRGENAEKVVKEAERRVAERRSKVGRRLVAERSKAGVEGKAPKHGSRRKAGSDPRGGGQSTAQIQAEIDSTKSQLKAAEAKKRTASNTTTQKNTTPAGTPASTGTATPQVEAPKTVSEQQKAKSNREFYRQRSARIAEQGNVQRGGGPTLPQNVPAAVTTDNATDEATRKEAKRRQTVERIGELEVATAEPGAKTHTPQMKSKTDKAGAAERSGLTEAEIKARTTVLPTVEAPEAPTVKPKASKPARTTPTAPRGLPRQSAGFDTTAPAEPATEADRKRVVDAIEKRMAEIEANLKVPDTETESKRVSKEEAYRQYEELKVLEKQKGVRAKAASGRLPLPKADSAKLPPVSDLIAEQRTAKGGPKPEAPRLHPPVRESRPPLPVKKHVGETEREAQDRRRFGENLDKYNQRNRKTTPKLTSPAIGVTLGSKVKAGVKGGAILTGLFSLLDSGEAAAKQHDPSKRAGAAKEAFKASAPHTAKEIAKYTAAAGVTSAALGSGVSHAMFGAAIPAALTYKVGKDYTIPKLKELGAQIEGAFTSRREARQEKKASEKKYGTVEAATKTRHAKEAYKKAQAKNKAKDLLTG